MKSMAATWVVLALVWSGASLAQTQPAKPAAQPTDAKPAAAPAAPPAGIPTLEYPTIAYAPQLAVPDTTALLGIVQKDGAVPFAPAQIAAPRANGLQMLTLQTLSYAPRRMEMLTLPILTYAARPASPAIPAGRATPGATGVELTYLKADTAPAYYMPSPVMQIEPMAPLQTLTVPYLDSPLQAAASQQATRTATPTPEPESVASGVLGLGLGVLGRFAPGLNTGMWSGLGNLFSGGWGGLGSVTPPTVDTVSQPYIPGMRY